MKIKVNQFEIELQHKITLFTPTYDLNTSEKLSLFIPNFSEIGCIPSYIFKNKHIKLIKEDFLSELKKKDYRKHLTCVTTNPLVPLFLPEDSCVYKVGKDDITKFESSFYRNLTPNTILTSPIFDFEDVIPESHLENERLRTEETYKKVKINDETRTFLREMAKKLKEDEKIKR